MGNTHSAQENPQAAPAAGKNDSKSSSLLNQEDKDRVDCLSMDSIINQAEIFNVKGQRDKSRQLFQHCLLVKKEKLGPGHPDTLFTMNDVAWIHLSHGEYDKAESLLSECISRSERVFGRNDSNTILTMTTLAKLYDLRGKYHDARSLHQESLSRKKATMGKLHPEDSAHIR